MSELNLVLLGPPGSGKGTQAEALQEELQLPYWATGNILRAAVEEGSGLGLEAKGFMDAGDLVPDSVVVGLIGERVTTREASDGFILDGFPRTIPQAEALDAEMERLKRSITAAILIDVSDDEVVRRLGGRRLWKRNGRIFHVEFDPPVDDDGNPVPDSELLIRDDDKPDVIRRRLELYHAKTAPLIEYYDDRGLLRRVDGSRTQDDVAGRISAILATLAMEDEL